MAQPASRPPTDSRPPIIPARVSGEGSERALGGGNLPRVVRFEFTFKTLVVALVFIGAVWAAVRLLPVLLVLVAALMLVGALNPVVERLQARRFSRKGAIAVVFGAGAIFVAGLMMLTIPPLIQQISEVAQREPEIRGRVIEWLERSRLTAALAEDLRNIDYQVLIKSSPATILEISKRAFEIVAYSIAAIFLAVYIMIDRDRLRGALFALVPRKHHIRLSSVMLNLEMIVGGYIRGQVITTALITVFILALLLICRVPNALALAVFGGLADVLPYIGPLLTIAPAVIAASAQGPFVAGMVFLLLLLYEEFESRILVPWVYGKALRLPSTVVFFSLLCGATLGGIVGALLALPIAAAVVMMIEELRVDLPGQTVGPDDVEMRVKDRIEEKEYEQRTQSVPVEEAAAVAVEIAKERKEEERTEG